MPGEHEQGGRADGAAASVGGRRRIRSTADVEAGDASCYWSEMVCRTLVQVAARPMSDDFSGRIEHFAVDHVGFSLISASAQDVQRTPSLIAGGQEDYALVNIQLDGQSWAAQDDRVTILSKGGMIFIDSTRPYSLSFKGAFSQLIVQVPKALLPRRALADATAVEIGPAGPGRIITDFLTGIEYQHRIDPLSVASLVPHAIGLLDSALSLAVRARIPKPSNAALTRERVRQFIQQHAGTPELDIDMVAAGCGLSRRTLFRALAAEGESFTSLLRRARVTLVQRMLRAYPDRSLAVVALQCGFAGEAQMYRAFRAVTGTTPATYRSGRHEAS
ncbi:helix-turn-helix domain-containing protein [Nonomuraea aridisoli]|uniref:AraC family transcriptional regulator n=1 Tax=Nonomuraea aridisoli TaxID=2070368 RepID=A0A2W2E9L0_9ACTN|nr:helix-turn-helix domain-containing protein [Nonomuraea aridisoli]PZG13855.1 AraC family transcriptional regulator [Nonomuraea aridisoli]